MKKILPIIIGAAVAVCAVTACASKPAATETAPVVLGANDIPRPDWVTKGVRSYESHYEVGYGKLSNYDTSRKRAEADARANIALWIKTDVKTVLNNYTQDSGVDDDRQLIEFMEEVSTQTAEVSISGVEIEDTWEDAEGGVYVLASYSINNAAQVFAATFDENIQDFERNESAAFAEFKAEEAFLRVNSPNANAR